MAKIVPVRTWNWVRAGNSWRYEEVVRERVVASGSGQAAADSFAVLAADVAWGRYRMAVRVPGAERAEASLSFNAGWGGGDIDRTPERLELVADRETYRAGRVARLRIPATLAGEAMVAIAWEFRPMGIPTQTTIPALPGSGRVVPREAGDGEGLVVWILSLA